MNHAGFALPLVLAWLAALSLVAATAFLLSTLELRMGQGHRTAVLSFYLADAALEDYLGTAAPPLAGRTYTFPGGTATVQPDALLRLEGEGSLYRLTARARSPLPFGGVARRALGALVVLEDSIASPAVRPGSWFEELDGS